MDTMTTTGSAEILNKIINIATGKEDNPADYSAGELIAVGTKLLKTDFNKFVTAMSQVMSYTIFKTERPYRRKFYNILRTSDRWGNHVRKVGMISREIIDDGQFFTETEKPWNNNNMFNSAPDDEVIQTNYYGKKTMEIPLKRYRNQLDDALSSINEFNTYYSMQMQTVNNDWEQAIENYSRTAVCNMIIGVLSGGSDMSKVNLLTKYNEAMGTSLTADDVHKKENYTDFIRFSYALIKTYMSYMTERSVVFHAPFEKDGEIIDFRRSTPLEYMNLYILTNEYENINARILADTFNTEYLNSSLFERVNFWENMRDPSHITMGGVYLNPQQEQATIEIGTHADKEIFAVIMDDECVGVNLFDEWTAASPFEAHRGFVNEYWHAQVRYWNSFEDNACVFYIADE